MAKRVSTERGRAYRQDTAKCSFLRRAGKQARAGCDPAHTSSGQPLLFTEKGLSSVSPGEVRRGALDKVSSGATNRLRASVLDGSSRRLRGPLALRHVAWQEDRRSLNTNGFEIRPAGTGDQRLRQQRSADRVVRLSLHDALCRVALIRLLVRTDCIRVFCSVAAQANACAPPSSALAMPKGP
jgi:hypothetical protein